jgi:hypothetical protein
MQATTATFTKTQVTAGKSTITEAGMRSLSLAPIFLKRHKANQAKTSKTERANPDNSGLHRVVAIQSGLLRPKILIAKHRTARAVARRATGSNSSSAAGGVEREPVLNLAAVAVAEENDADISG